MVDEQCAYQALVKVLGPQPPLVQAAATQAARRHPGSRNNGNGRRILTASSETFQARKLPVS